jgi:hypothetical protein
VTSPSRERPPLVVLARMPASAAETLALDVVGEWWGRAPYTLRVERSRGGKPYVVDSESTLGPPFNISHSRAWIAVAVAASGDVGVDVERVRPVKPRVAQRVFGTVDLTDDEFTRRWAIAEACAKADGRGIALLLEGSFPAAAETGTWRGYHWRSGRIADAHWAVALSEPISELDIRIL